MSDYHQTTLRLPDDLRAALKSQAALERRSMGNLIIDLCQLGLTVRAQSNEKRLDEFKRIIRAAGQS